MGPMTPPPAFAPPPASGSAPPPRPDKRSSFIPAITDQASARSAGKQGAYAAFVCAAATALFAALAAASVQGPQELGINAWAFLDAAFFVGIGIGIWRMNRVFAVLGLVFYLVERIVMVVDHPDSASKGAVMVIILVLAFANGIRGTFAFHRFKVLSVPPPIPDGSLNPS